LIQKNVFTVQDGDDSDFWRGSGWDPLSNEELKEIIGSSLEFQMGRTRPLLLDWENARDSGKSFYIFCGEDGASDGIWMALHRMPGDRRRKLAILCSRRW